MKRQDWEILLLIGLFVALSYQAGNVILDTTGDVVASVINKLSYAIAIAEGFFKAGSRSARNHNPGDLETDVTGKGIGFDGAYVIYGSDSDGWDALNHQVALMFGGSHIYTPSMTISQVAYAYADGAHDPEGAAAWASNVASQLGVSIDTKLSELTS